MELKNLEDLPKALNMNGQRFVFKNGKLGFPIVIQASEAEKNYQHEKAKTQVAEAAATRVAPRRIRVRNLPESFAAAHVETLFKPCGDLEGTPAVVADDEGKSTGEATVVFVRPEDAARAVEKINGVDVMGKSLSVELLAEPPPVSTAAAAAAVMVPDVIAQALAAARNPGLAAAFGAAGAAGAGGGAAGATPGMLHPSMQHMGMMGMMGMHPGMMAQGAGGMMMLTGPGGQPQQQAMMGMNGMPLMMGGMMMPQQQQQWPPQPPPGQQQQQPPPQPPTPFGDQLASADGLLGLPGPASQFAPLTATSRVQLMARLASSRGMAVGAAAGAAASPPPPPAGAPAVMGMGMLGVAGGPMSATGTNAIPLGVRQDQLQPQQPPLPPLVAGGAAQAGGAAAAAAAAVGAGPALGAPGACLVLKNMFDAAEEAEANGPEWNKLIEEDVTEECSKHGNVLHCHVDPESKGFV